MDTPLFKVVSDFCELFPKKIQADDLVYLLSLSRFQEKGYFDEDRQIINYMICLSANFHRELVYNCVLANMKLVSPVDLSEHIVILVQDFLENRDEITIAQNLVEELAAKWVDFENGTMMDYMNDFIDKMDIPMGEPSHEDSKESYQVEMEHSSVEEPVSQEEPKPVEEKSIEEPKPVEELSQEEPKPVEELSQEEPKPVEEKSQEEPKPVEELSQEEPKPVEEKSQEEEKPVEETTQEEPKPVEEISHEEEKSQEEKTIETVSGQEEAKPTEEQPKYEEISVEEKSENQKQGEINVEEEPTQETVTEEIPKSAQNLKSSNKGNYCSYLEEADCKRMTNKKNMPCYWIAEEDGTSHCEQKTEVGGGSILFGEYKSRRKFYR